MTRNTKLISSYKLLGISPEVIQSYYYDVPTKNIRCVAPGRGPLARVTAAVSTGVYVDLLAPLKYVCKIVLRQFGL